MQYALIAGGSKGIGYAIATALAKRKYNLVLVARTLDDLEKAKNILETTYGIHVEMIQQDLSVAGAAEKVSSIVIQKKLPVSMLCNVAGLGGIKDFLSMPLDELRYMMSLNFSFPVALCHCLIPLLEKNTPAYILNVASMAGLSPIPKKNIYSATKSAVIFFSRSLRFQLIKKQISVSCLCPGPVFTKPDIEKETMKNLGWFGKLIAVPPVEVGEIAVARTLKGNFIITPGGFAKIMSVALRILPTQLIAYIYYRLGQKQQ